MAKKKGRKRSDEPLVRRGLSAAGDLALWVDKAKIGFDTRVDRTLVKGATYSGLVTTAYHAADILRHSSNWLAAQVVTRFPGAADSLEGFGTYLLDSPELTQAAALVGAGFAIGKEKLGKRFTNWAADKVNDYTKKRKKAKKGSGILGWVRTGALLAAMAPVLLSTVGAIRPPSFSPTGEQTSGGYDIFEYHGRERRQGEIDDIFDEWDAKQGDRCKNTGSRNVFFGDDGTAYVKAGCDSTAIARARERRERRTQGDDDDTDAPTNFTLDHYRAGTPEMIALFEAAADEAGVPKSWARSDALYEIYRRESANGTVGIPNYTIRTKDGRMAKNHPETWDDIHQSLKDGSLKPGSSRAKSSATGLGQLLLSNVERYYPDGRDGIGDPLNEAAGMLAYIEDRYGSPERAWALYGVNHEGY